MTAPPPRKDFFISYNQADKAWAEWLAWQLEDAGYTTVLQAWDFRPGGNFVLEMDRAAQIADRTLAVLSDDFLNASYTQPEWAAAFAQDPTGAGQALVPVRVRKCDLAGLLKQIIYIDLVGLDEPAAREKLIAGVKLGRAKPSRAPGFPGIKVYAAPRFPGAFPPIWNIRHIRNPNFTGRKELLDELREALTSGGRAALTQAIHGLGGVGKTQLAVEYAYRHAPEYDLVWWCRAEDSATLAGDFASLAQELGLPEKDAPDQEAQVKAVLRELRRRPGWLLILDNAEEPQAVQKYLVPGGRVIITSRNRGWRGVAGALAVRVMEPEEAADFLLTRTGQTDRNHAEILADELGFLPLALEQAGAYMEATGASLSEYLDLYRTRRRELWGEEKAPLNYEETVTTTWEISFQRLERESPGGAELLYLSAFLAPEDIPLSLLNQGTEHLPETLAGVLNNPLAFKKAVAALRRYSLLEVVEDSLAVHRLVQAVVRDRLGEEGRKEWAGAAAKLVNGAFPGDITTNMDSWPQCARLLPHALATAGHAGKLQVAPDAAARLFNQAGLYLQARAEFAEARKAFERALAIDEATYGPNHPEVATDVNNLGNVLQALWDLAGAKAHFERALAIDEAAFGPNHPEVASDVNNLGSVLQDLGDLPGARAHFERALNIFEAALGPNHPQVATLVNNLGGVLQDLGDLPGARAHFERALAIFEAALGPNHPQVATCVNNLGLVLGALGDLPGARAHFERALAIDEAAYGPSHPEVATDVNNLGRVLRALGDLAGARAHFERALAIIREFLGDEHPQTKIVRNNLETLLRELENG